jgi:hypothetical protein
MKAFLTRALVFAFPCVAVAQIAILQIKVLEGEGVAHPAGARVSRPLTVQVTDEMGQAVAGATVSFQLPPEGPSGLFSNGLRTDLAITDVSGRASIHSIQLNRNGGQLRIRITAVKEQARAGIVSFQTISDSAPAPVVPAAPAPPAPAPAAAPVTTAAPGTTAAPPSPSPAITPTPQRSAGPSAEHSPGITPTTEKMGTRISKKWILLTVVAVAAGAAALGISHASSSKSSTSTNTGTTIGTPTITIGSPNP